MRLRRIAYQRYHDTSVLLNSASLFGASPANDLSAVPAVRAMHCRMGLLL